MAELLAPLAAPGRGQYDRRQPREARLLEQRARLLSATAFAVLQSAAPTVATVVKLAGVSRNTFYEYFDDLEHARREAERRAQQRLERALGDAEVRTRTPVERWRALSQAWFAWAEASPSDALLCLVPERERLSAAGRELEGALERSLRGLRAPGELQSLGVTAVAAAGEAFMRSLFHVQPPVVGATGGTPALALADSAPPGAPVPSTAARVVPAPSEPKRGVELGRAELGRVERALVDVAVRLLR